MVSIGHFYFAQIGHYHFAATFPLRALRPGAGSVTFILLTSVSTRLGCGTTCFTSREDKMKLSLLGLAIVFLAGPAVAVADDLEDAVQSLKQAVANKDVDAVKKLAATIRPMTAEILAVAAPADADEKKDWEARNAYAKSSQLYVESAFYTVAVQSEPAVLVDLIATLEQQNPKSKYLNQAYGAYLVALDKNGEKAKIPAIAKKGLASFPENEDLLLYLTDAEMTAKRTDRKSTR